MWISCLTCYGTGWFWDRPWHHQRLGCFHCSDGSAFARWQAASRLVPALAFLR